MKKLRIFSVILLIISAGAFIVFRIFAFATKDSTPPVLTCDSEEIVVSVQTPRDELTAGVTAQDDRSGDVTDTLVVEKLSDFTSDGKRIVTYAAVDDSNNVGRCERTLVYSDYQPPVFHLNAPLCFPAGQNVDFLKAISAESTLDGSLTDHIKYSLERIIDIGTVGEYPVEFEVTDSAGNRVSLNTQIEIYDKDYAGIQVSLNDYLVYAQAWQPFDPYIYYAGADEEGVLSIESNLNPNEAGTYYVDYIVTGERKSGKSRLIVVVQ